MPWIWYANRTLGRHLVMPGDCCSHWLGFASRISLKWQHPPPHPSFLSFSLSLLFSCSEGCYASDVCQNMAMLGSRRKEHCRSLFPFYGWQKMVQIYFSQWLTQFQNYVIQKIRKEENEWKWILFMCNWKWQLFILFSEYRETDAIKRQQLWHISHYNLQTLIHAEGECVGQTLKKKKNKRKKELLQKWWHFMFRNPWSHWELDFLLSVPSFTLQIDKVRLIWAFNIHCLLQVVQTLI